MKTIFADTFYFLALVNPDDEAHAKASAFATSYLGNLVTTWGILLEVADGLAKPSSRKKAMELFSMIQGDLKVATLPLSEDLLDRATTLYRLRPDKGWSLTDCISFEVMTELGLTEALTADHHFEQAGFVALLKQ
jgi:uncharacterized protein